MHSYILTRNSLKLEDKTNFSHYVSIGVTLCIPLPCLSFNDGIVSWKDFKLIRGGGFKQFFIWLYGVTLDLDERNLLLHYKYVTEKTCHIWKGEPILYHDGYTSISR